MEGIKCALEGKVSHSNITPRFKETFVQCAVFARGEGMKSVGISCAGCCIRLQQLIEAKNDLLLRQTFTREDLQKEPDIIEHYLPEQLLEYFKAIRSLDITLDKLEGECNKCRAVPVEAPVATDVEATKMNYVGRDNLRV